MNNLTTRKIVLGLLMALVLVFSVQGTADAISTYNTGEQSSMRQGEDSEYKGDIYDIWSCIIK